MDYVSWFWESGFVATVVASLVVVGLAIGLLRHLPLSDPGRLTLRQFLLGPVLVTILGAGLYELAVKYVALGGTGLSGPVTVYDLFFLYEVAILISATVFVAIAVRRYTSATRLRGGHTPVYSVIAAAFLVLIVLVLTTPGFPMLAAASWQFVEFLAGVIGTFIAVEVLNHLLRRYFDARAEAEPGFATLYSVMRRVILGVVVFVGILITAFASFPDISAGLASLVLAAGFLAVVVGLAAQSTLSNIIAGMLVATTQPIHLGDAVVFPYPNGDWCYVEDIKLNYTVLRTWDLRRLMVPNALLQSNIVVNYTTVDPTMLVIVYLVITYESDVDRARAIMVEEARKHPDFQPLGNLPVTHVMDYQGGGGQGAGRYGGVDLRLLSAAKDQPTAFQVEKDLLYSIRKRFQQEGIQLAYPTQRVILDPPGPPISDPRPPPAPKDD